MSNKSIKIWYSLGLGSLLLLNACRFGEATGGENNGASGGRKQGDGSSLLFMGKVPDPEGIAWTYESGTQRSSIGSLNPEIFSAETSPLAKQGSRMTFNLFEGQEFIAIVNKVKKKSDTRFTAYGEIEGIKDSHFFTAVAEGALSAVIDLPETGKFRVEYAHDGLYRVIKMNSFNPPLVPVEKMPVVNASSPGLGKVGAVMRPQTGTTIISVAIFYTAVAASSAGGTAAMEANIETAIAEANQAYVNSGVNLELDCVYKGQVTYTESGSMNTDLERIQRTSDGYMDGVHTIRNSVNADLVALITLRENSGYAGLGYTFSPPLTTGFAPYGFVVVLKPYLTGYSVLTHEFGHNMGCHHDPANASGSGAYSYSYGHKFVGSNGVTYRTVMAYPPGVLVNYFSNPNVSYMSTATGTALRNNALSLTNTAGIVASFKGDSNPPTSVLSYPKTGSTYASPANIILRSTPTDDGAISKVEFYADNVLVGTDYTAPYVLPYSFTTGSHSVYAKATDLSSNSTSSSTATFSVGSSALTAPWTDRYIGSSGITGNATNTSAQFRLISGGQTSNVREDHFHFIYRSISSGTLSSGARLIVKIDSLHSAISGSKAGIMLRDSLITSSPAFFLGITETGEVNFDARLTNLGKMATVASFPSVTFPYYLMLMRKGNEVSAYRSPNKTNWTFMKALTYKSDNTMYMGLATRTADSGTVDTAWYDSVSMSTSLPSHPPKATLSGLFENQSLNANSIVLLRAAASDRDGRIRRVQFYNGSTLLGVDSITPYQILDTLTAGSYSIYAKATDTSGEVGTSNTISVTVEASANKVVNPSADSYVRDGKYQNLAYGLAANLLLNGDTTPNNKSRIYFLFPISALSSINAATLRVYNTPSTPTAREIQVSGCDSLSWTESSLKYSNMPVNGSVLDTYTSTGRSGAWAEFDIGSYVQAKKLAGKTSVCLVLTAPANRPGQVSIPSRAAGLGKPELVLEP